MCEDTLHEHEVRRDVQGKVSDRFVSRNVKEKLQVPIVKLLMTVVCHDTLDREQSQS